MAAGGLCGKRHNNRLFRGEGQAVSLRNTDRSFDVQVGSNRSDRSTPLFGRNPCRARKFPVHGRTGNCLQRTGTAARIDAE